MSGHVTLKAFTRKMERKYPHLAEIGALRDEADQITGWIVTNLGTVRRGAKKRQEAVAKALGVSQATISRYENGLEDISLRDYVLFALACGQKPALVLVPEKDSIQSEQNSQDVVENMVGQLYPELEINLFDPKKQDETEQERTQVTLAARAVSYGLTSLGLALRNLNLAKRGV